MYDGIAFDSLTFFSSFTSIILLSSKETRQSRHWSSQCRPSFQGRLERSLDRTGPSIGPEHVPSHRIRS